MFDTVLWDIDGTLMDFKKSEHEALYMALSSLGYVPGEEEIALYSRINDSCWKRYEKGELDYDGIFTLRFREFFDVIGISLDISRVNEIYRKNLGEIFFLNDGAKEVVKKLRGDGVRQYIVTNGYAQTQMRKAEKSGLSAIVDGIFISGLIGCPKPEKRFFDECFEKIGSVDKDRTVIVGDSLSSDILGGNNAGIRTVWFNTEGNENDKGVTVWREAKTLYEVYDIIKKENG